MDTKNKSLVKNNKPIQIYFQSPTSNDVTKIDPKIVDEYNKILPVDVITCDSWEDLNTLILHKPNQITIHANVFMLTDLTTIAETIKMLQTKLKIVELDIPIAIVVEKTTPRYLVEKAKELGILGVVPYHGDWDSVDIMQGLNSLTNRVPYWPQHILNELPSIAEKPIHVIFRKDWREVVTSSMVEAIKENTGLIVKACSEWNELGDALRENPKQMTVHIDMIGLHGVTVHEFMSMLETLIRMSSIRTIPIAIIIDHTTPMSVIKELQKTNVMGIIPSTPSFGIPEGIKGLEALINRIPYWPKHILDQLPGAKKKVLKNTIKLTQRQAQIVNLISERGLTNKKIAQALNITESTVKIHVSAILKAYGVRTRTQLALAAIK
jgi:DNA-binding NarL/FixJ family response regulator